MSVLVMIGTPRLLPDLEHLQTADLALVVLMSAQ